MNNTNKKCPPVNINNGIMMTDYRPSKVLYTNVRNSHEFRQYLQSHGTQIMEKNRQLFDKRFGCEREIGKDVVFNVKPYSEYE